MGQSVYSQKRRFSNLFKICFAIALIIFSNNPLPAQRLDSTSKETYEFYLKKSKSQRTAGLILVGAGISMASIGAVIGYGQAWNYFLDIFEPDQEKYDNTGDILAYTGLAVIGSGIPFLLAAGKNKRKARS